MKIEQIRFKNLNSLVGEWSINLNHPDYVSNGIFAITGPTGSGKTTILDAICLALYGRTPRLNRVTKGVNEIMSRQTGECFAEVLFVTPTGRYFCHWSQHRARRKADGELQSPKHEVSDANTGTILESNIREVNGRIIELTGMDFDRFTRSMLLAQGRFAAFLHAAADERAPLLEQITGTAIYSQISQFVHLRLSEEQKKLDQLKSLIAGIPLLEPLQERASHDELQQKSQAETTAIQDLQHTQQALNWLTELEHLQTEITSLNTESAQLTVALSNFEPERERLNQAINAASLDAEYATLKSARQRYQSDQSNLTLQQEALTTLEQQAQQYAQSLNQAEQHTLLTKQKLKEANPLLIKVRALDHTLSTQAKHLQDLQQDCQKDSDKISADQALWHEQNTLLVQHQQQLQQIDTYLSQHATDAYLTRHLAGIHVLLDDLLLKQNDLQQTQTQISQTEQAAQAAQQALILQQASLQQNTQALASATQHVQQQQQQLSTMLNNRLLREYRAEKDVQMRELVFLTRIAELEEQRHLLEDGTPCPLCGALEHPYAMGNVPEKNVTEQRIHHLAEFIENAEKLEMQVQQSQQIEQQAAHHVTQAQVTLESLKHQLQQAQLRVQQTRSQLAQQQQGLSNNQQSLLEQLTPLGITDLAAVDLHSLGTNLTTRLEAWQQQLELKANCTQHIQLTTSAITRLEAIIQTQSHSLADKQHRLQKIQAELSAHREARADLYGHQNPDLVEQALQEAISLAETQEKSQRFLQQSAAEQLSNVQSAIRRLQQTINESAPKLDQLTTQFLSAAQVLGFRDEVTFNAAILSTHDRQQLSQRAKQLEQRQTELKTKQSDRNARLLSRQAEAKTEQSKETLTVLLQEQELALKDLRTVIATLSHLLSENDKAKQRIQEHRCTIDTQKAEYLRIKLLHELIGSADGKKFRNFAQGLTFQLMIQHANQQLAQMNDRYLLVQDKLQPLDLNVLDNYQGGEIRSTKNLSGGESFIVSLALALGLSQMSSRHVRVDSLFLDEGFGTLDEEALETALSTLASLQQDGKVIGIISHVTSMKERISTQILVNPETGGRSNLSGPGCKQI